LSKDDSEMDEKILRENRDTLKVKCQWEELWVLQPISENDWTTRQNNQIANREKNLGHIANFLTFSFREHI
jgi:hypothetical protein